MVEIEASEQVGVGAGAGEGQGFWGDRPRESLIFQHFRDIGLVAIPILASLGCFPEMNNFTGKKGPFYVIALV